MKKTLLLSAICVATLNVFAQTWTQIDSLPGSPRDGGVSFVIDSLAYEGGGYTSGIYLSSFYSFSPSTGIWSQVASIPDSLVGSAGFALNGKGYLVSGTDGSGYFQTVFQYDPVANQWNTMSDFPGSGRQEGFAFATDSFGYVFGGHAGGGVVNDLWQYNPTNDSWVQKTSMPANPRSGSAGFVINGIAYIGLGGNNDGSAMYQDMYGYNIATDTWDTIATFPGHVRRNSVGFSYNNKYGYIGLGVYYSTVTQLDTFYNDMYVYDPLTNGWSPYTPFPGLVRSAANCFVVGSIAYVGSGISDTSTLKDWWQLTDVDAITAVNVNKVVVFPDPATNIIRLDLGQTSSDNSILEIFDQLGQRVKNIPLNDLQSIEVNVNDLSVGFYIYQLSDNGKVSASGKFAVMR